MFSVGILELKTKNSKPARFMAQPEQVKLKTNLAELVSRKVFCGLNSGRTSHEEADHRQE
jgi:hypothetical protein